MDVGLFFYIIYVITFFAVALVMALVVYPSAWNIAVLFEQRNKNTLRLGGIAVASGFLLPCISAGYFGNEGFRAIMAGGAVILIGGIIKDVFETGKTVNFVFTLSSACIFTLLGNRLEQITVAGNQLHLGILSFPLTVFILMSAMTAFHVINEHSTGIGAMCSITLLVVSLAYENIVVAGEMAALVGASVGCLFYNGKTKKLFPEGSGEQLMGFIISSSSFEILSSDSQALSIAWIPIAMTMVAGLLFFYDKISCCRNDTAHKTVYNVSK